MKSIQTDKNILYSAIYTGGIKFTFSIKVSYPNFIMSEPTKSA